MVWLHGVVVIFFLAALLINPSEEASALEEAAAENIPVRAKAIINGFYDLRLLTHLSEDHISEIEKQHIKAVASAYADSAEQCPIVTNGHVNGVNGVNGDVNGNGEYSSTPTSLPNPWLTHLMQNLATAFLANLLLISDKYIEKETLPEHVVEEVVTKYALWTDSLGPLQSIRDEACRRLESDKKFTFRTRTRLALQLKTAYCGGTLFFALDSFSGAKYSKALKVVVGDFLNLKPPAKFPSDNAAEDKILWELHAAAKALLTHHGDWKEVPSHAHVGPHEQHHRDTLAETRPTPTMASVALDYLERWATKLSYTTRYHAALRWGVPEEDVPKMLGQTLGLFGDKLMTDAHLVGRLVLHNLKARKPAGAANEQAAAADGDVEQQGAGGDPPPTEFPKRQVCGSELCRLTFKELFAYKEWLDQTLAAENAEWTGKVPSHHELKVTHVEEEEERDVEADQDELAEALMKRGAKLKEAVDELHSMYLGPRTRPKLTGPEGFDLVALRDKRIEADYAQFLEDSKQGDLHHLDIKQANLVQAAKFMMLSILGGDQQWAIVGALYWELFYGPHNGEDASEKCEEVLEGVGIDRGVLHQLQTSMHEYNKRKQSSFFEIVKEGLEKPDEFSKLWKDRGYGSQPYPLSNAYPQLHKNCWLLPFMFGGMKSAKWLTNYDQKEKWVPEAGILGHSLPADYQDQDEVNPDGSGLNTIGVFHDTKCRVTYSTKSRTDIERSNCVENVTAYLTANIKVFCDSNACMHTHNGEPNAPTIADVHKGEALPEVIAEQQA